MGKEALAFTRDAADEILYIRTYAKEGETERDYYRHAFVKYLQRDLCTLNSFPACSITNIVSCLFSTNSSVEEANLGYRGSQHPY
jgi:hypothetical protein